VATILLSAGDLSGEAHAAALVEAVRARLPGTRFVGLGGERMRAAGVEIVVEQRALAVAGIAELVPELGRIARAWRRLGRALVETRPALVVLVDSGGFNLPFAGRVKRTTGARILYFIAPQIWAWRPGRLARLARRADRIVVGLPFERAAYPGRGVEVACHAHPAVDAFARPRRSDPPGETPAERRRRARRALDLPLEGTLVGLFPGSRRSELARHVPLFLDAFARLAQTTPGGERLRAVVGLAPGVDAAAVAARAGEAIRCLPTGDGALLDALDFALAKPGTITLEAALHGCPIVVAGRVHPLTALVARRSLQVPFVALPNLIAGEPIVPERLQEEATPERIAEALAALSDGAVRERQRAALARVVASLGPPGAIDATAALVEEMLGSDRA